MLTAYIFGLFFLNLPFPATLQTAHCFWGRFSPQASPKTFLVVCKSLGFSLNFSLMAL